jgi:hypothetical protein
MPGGVPRWLRCYDHEEMPVRYTAVFTGRAPVAYLDGKREYPYVSMSNRPTHPQGVGAHDSNSWQPIDTTYRDKGGWSWPPAIGRKHWALGTRIRFEDLPPECKVLVLSDYEEIWDCASRYYVEPSVITTIPAGQTFYIVDRQHSEIIRPYDSTYEAASKRVTELNAAISDLAKRIDSLNRRDARRAAKQQMLIQTQKSEHGRELRSISL